jgi:hypothetical protein
MWNVKNKSVTSNNRSSWNQLRIIQMLPEQHTGKAHNQEMTKSSHIGHCTCTSESTKVKVQNIFNMLHNITCRTNCKYRKAATLYKLETLFVSGI